MFRIKNLIVIIFFFLTFSSSVQALVRPIAFPVDGQATFRNDFLEPRDGGARQHLGNDIIADKMTPVIAAVDGYVSFIVSPEASWGYSITVQDADGYTYRYLHLNNDTPGTDDGLGGETHAYAPGMARGVRVTKGQGIGWTGDSGNAENTVSHLHFEIRDPNHGAVNPFDSLISAAGPLQRVASSPNGGYVTVNHGVITDADIEFQVGYLFTKPLYEGTSGEDVRQLQIKLQALGFYKSPITGFFSVDTRNALMQYQNARGIQIAGYFTMNSLGAMNNEKVALPKSSSAPQSLSEGSRGEAVRTLQQKLRDLGYYMYPAITGYFGPITKAAVIAYQRGNGIDPIGIVGPRTRAKLYGA
ncbi:MAG: hypothetical protein A3A28_00580 [Candidatus Sungbacteria bacterium RIFCSPLOWO2_01_FULL_47_32]|uniref:Peptidase M23 domain-containing protein n=1 Tax=Candidatus Sungbacteria bacterium RIFCSPHIGHO2_01_FULL_47_32 TaxID=1802264 RepID=A0A1G2K729_9BACT|nr:MAG: hypothetical protein A2633_00170 [Candidatus Sungbacteria bacterium RIFCSPHIGHO2_01_FULL_47_32]OHA05393.1 MAG: hypothetical protein A3A28_00580 [Candidatus Sungbacteria bacterium RIFCSPLOWO2_01_FULL_47_32]